VYYSAKYPNEFIAVRTSITVPEKPPTVGTVFLWPGLDPGPSPRFLPIDNGVLQPVLTWGTSCAPGLQPPAYTSWWISAQYVNTFGHEPGYTDCHGGPNMRVSPGDVLDLSLQLHGTIWTQIIRDERTNGSARFAFDLRGQPQNLLYFGIERYGGRPISPVRFRNTTIAVARHDPAACRGRNDTNGDPRNHVSPSIFLGVNAICHVDTIAIFDRTAPRHECLLESFTHQSHIDWRVAECLNEAMASKTGTVTGIHPKRLFNVYTGPRF